MRPATATTATSSSLTTPTNPNNITTTPAEAATMTRSPLEGVKLRRAFLGTSIAAGAVLAACGRSAPRPAPANNSMATAIASTEAARPHTGRTVTATLTPQPTTIDLGGTTARTAAGSRFPFSVADDSASTCRFAEFSSKWRSRFSHLRGGS
jgi:hypothetical protein